MDKGDLTSSGSDMSKKPKLDDSVKHSVADPEDDSVADPEDDSVADPEDDFVTDSEDDTENDEEEEKRGHNAMAKWFIADGIDPNIVKKPSFLKLMGYMTPNLVPCASLVKKQVLEIHQEYKEKAKKFLRDFEGTLTLSYEWLLLGSSEEFIQTPILHYHFTSITAHFIDDNWKVRDWVLGYTTDQSIPMDDIYPYHFRSAVQGFEIEDKVSTILLPNHEEFNAEMVAAIRKCLEKNGNSSINPQVFAIYCCADLFRVMAEDVFSVFSGSLLEDLRMLVGWGRCLTQPYWNVWLHNLERAVDMKAEDAFSKDDIYDDYDKPSDDDWIKIETFCKLTGCVYKVAKVLFEEGYSTSNLYFHLLFELKVMLNQALASADNEYFLGKAKGIMTRFSKYWNDMFLVLATASVLDPRFKLKYLEFYCSKEKDSKAETVLDYLRNLYARYAARDVCQKPICPVTTIDDVVEENEEEDDDDEEEEEGEGEGETQKETEEKKADAYEKFVMFQEYLKFEESTRELQDTELDSYLKEPVMEWNKDFKALEWWKEESQKYPILSRVARDILSIPISRATSYDAYAPDKREPPELVLSMEPELSNAMMCSKSWFGVFGH